MIRKHNYLFIDSSKKQKLVFGMLKLTLYLCNINNSDYQLNAVTDRNMSLRDEFVYYSLYKTLQNHLTSKTKYIRKEINIVTNNKNDENR